MAFSGVEMDMPWGVSMLIDKAVASKLKHVLETVQPYPVVIYDRKGTIAAGPNGKRIGACHRGILRCLDGWPDQSADMPEHVRCITFKGAAVGAVELLGLNAEDAPYLTMAEAIVELLLERDTSFSSVGTIDPALQQALTTLVGVHPSDCTSLLHELSRNGVSLSVPRTTLLIQLSRVEKMTLKNNFREPIVDDRQFHHLMDHFFEQLPVYFSNENDFILPNPEKQSAFVLYADRSDTLDVNAIGIFNTCRELERLAARGQLLDMHAVIGTRCCTLADYERQYEQLEIRLSAGRLLRSDQHIILGPSVVLGSMVLYDSIDTRKKITAFVFGKLLASRQRDVLLDTLHTYFDCNMNATMTADRLFIHRNTLQQRLHRIADLTGYSTDTADGLLTLRLGLLQYSSLLYDGLLSSIVPQEAIEPE